MNSDCFAPAFRGLIAALILGAAGCVSTNFVPSARPVSASTAVAVRFYDDDVNVLAKAGGRVIGRIDARGGSWASYDSLTDKAASEAAENGGTHFMLSTQGSEDFEVTLSAASSRTVCNNGGTSCNTTYSEPAKVHGQKPTAGFIVVRVPQENWALLPENLRPGSRVE